MATALQDEELIAQAQERERARLEEEAAILAAQQAQIQTLPPPVWAGSSGEAIDQFNAQPGVLSAPTTVDSAQYANELARAQRGSGFIAPNVSPTGEVISPAYDPELDPRAVLARKEAANLQRNQYVSSLVQGGATYAEALRAALGRYPSVGDPNTMLRAEALALKQKPQLLQPQVSTIDGVRVLRTGPNSFSRVPDLKPATIPKAIVPPDAAASQKVITGQIADARKTLERANKAVEEDRTDAAAVNAALRAREKLRSLEQNLIAGSTNWMGAAQAPSKAPMPAQPAAATPPTSAEKVVVVKDGKRFYLPKSQLDEALKAGYKQGQ